MPPNSKVHKRTHEKRVTFCGGKNEMNCQENIFTKEMGEVNTIPDLGRKLTAYCSDR